MIQIQCTSKLLKEYDIETRDYNIDDKLYKWHANLFMIEDVKCIVLINDLALYGFIIYNVTEDEYFSTIVREALEKNLLAQHAGQEQVDEYLDNEIVFSKTSNRRVIGKMNSLVQYTTLENAYGDEDIEILNLKLGEYDFIKKLYVGEYMVKELNKRMPDNKFDRRKLDNEARRKWDAIPSNMKLLLINNVFCGSCGVTSIVDFEIENNDLGIILQGKCIKCGKEVARYIEDE